MKFIWFLVPNCNISTPTKCDSASAKWLNKAWPHFWIYNIASFTAKWLMLLHGIASHWVMIFIEQIYLSGRKSNPKIGMHGYYTPTDCSHSYTELDTQVIYEQIYASVFACAPAWFLYITWIMQIYIMLRYNNQCKSNSYLRGWWFMQKI